jgi:ABC-type polysaccharide/polyol phosphate transport system ATPase subunit
VASITLDDVVIDFPLYGVRPGLRSTLVRRAVGGFLQRSDDADQLIVVRALDHVTVKLRHGDLVGLVGHNGAGKSTLLRVLAGIYEPILGRCEIVGGVSPLFNGAPGLHPDDTGYENIITCGLLLGMTRDEIERKIPDIGTFAELGDFLSLPVRTYSAGMVLRIGFAIATAIDPDILLLDEGISAGDARFALHARERMKALISRSSVMVLASHSDDLIRAMCNRAILLDRGKIVADGRVDDILAQHQSMSTDADKTSPKIS